MGQVLRVGFDTPEECLESQVEVGERTVADWGSADMSRLLTSVRGSCRAPGSRSAGVPREGGSQIPKPHPSDPSDTSDPRKTQKLHSPFSNCLIPPLPYHACGFTWRNKAPSPFPPAAVPPSRAMPETPEQLARQKIDAQLVASGWLVQDYKAFNSSAGRGIALREVPLKSGRCNFPPLAGQTRIVAEVERRLSVVEESETLVSASLQWAVRLRQSILQKAFTSQLVEHATLIETVNPTGGHYSGKEMGETAAFLTIDH